MELQGIDPAQIDDWNEAEIMKTEPADLLAVKPGSVVTQVNGQDVTKDQFWKLNQALAASTGKPVDLTVWPRTAAKARSPTRRSGRICRTASSKKIWISWG